LISGYYGQVFGIKAMNCDALANHEMYRRGMGRAGIGSLLGVAALAIGAGCSRSQPGFSPPTQQVAAVSATAPDQGAPAEVGETYDVGGLGLSSKDQGDNIGLGPRTVNRKKRSHDSAR
jgi:hypothetical protein